MNMQEITKASQKQFQNWLDTTGAKVSNLERLADESKQQLARAQRRERDRTARLETFKRDNPRPSTVKLLLEELMAALAPCFPGLEPEILGPFGICCEYSLSFKNPTDEDQCKSLVVTLRDTEVRWRDYSVNTGEFAPNTIGAMNGMNYPDVPISPDASIEEIAALFK